MRSTSSALRDVDLSSVPAWVAEVIPADTLALYVGVLRGLNEREIPFLVGGAYAMKQHADIERHTRDLDLFVSRETLPAIQRAAREMGLEAHEFSPHWLWKITTDVGYVDLIWGSGNGAAPVDDWWFARAVESEVFGVPVRLIPAEEMIWSKAYIQERERFDGADIAHILHRRADSLDWEHLLERFGPHWRVLLEHLVAFGFIYPGERHRVPPFVMRELISRLHDDVAADATHAADLAGATGATSTQATSARGPEANGDDRVCGGTLLSRSQYLIDLRERGYRDARLAPRGAMTQEQIDAWTRRAETEAAAALPFEAPNSKQIKP